MLYTTLPKTDLKVSKICLGSMTWGNQNTKAEAHEQLDYALSQGVNFIDTAEMYPIPASPSTQGETSKIIGQWLNNQKQRSNVVIASKIIGRSSDYTKHIRTIALQGNAIEEAINNELKRLQTDYIDLYQIHWPERETNTFAQRDYIHQSNDAWQDNFGEVLHKFDTQIKAGKIRYVGISNEKAWGTMRFLEASKQHNLPCMRTIQNAYSLVNRGFEGDMAEIAMRENIGLLAYSPLAFGTLSGKYITAKNKANFSMEVFPELLKSRLQLFPSLSRYSSASCALATEKYLAVAKQNGLSLTQMSLAFVNAQPFVTSNIIGATTLDQLKENIASIELTLSKTVIQQINEVHKEIPNPAA